ncbi:MAG TPA: major capsid family protein [Kofleriaceae bacterium]|jgi:hypothetical protein
MNLNEFASRIDGVDSYWLSNQLQKLDPTKYYKVVPGLVGRKNLPLVEGASPNLPVYKYALTEFQGSAKKTGPGGRDGGTIKVIRRETTQAVKTIKASFGWTVDDIRAASETGQDLPGDSQVGAVNTIEQQIDGLLCTGDSPTGIPGIANFPGVATTAPVIKDGGSATAWNATGADPYKIVQDVANIITAANSALKQAQLPGSDVPAFDQYVLFLPYDRWTLIATTPLNPSSGSPVTILAFIEANFKMLKAIVPWWRLSTADASHSNGPMMVLAPAMDNGTVNPMSGGALIPRSYEQLAEQYDDDNIIIPARGKCGGYVMRHVVAYRYMLQI